MQFISKFFNIVSDVKKLQKEADDVLELPGDLKALRKEDEITVIDSKKKKVVKKLKDTFPSNPARATLQIIKKLKLASTYENYKESIDKHNLKNANKDI